jgi:feruloyl esterase
LLTFTGIWHIVVAGIVLSSLPVWARPCASLASVALPHATITVAEMVTSGTFAPATGKPLTGLPPFCRVAATLTPSSDSAIRVEIWMPESAWNQRLEGTGNGGFAGNINYGPLAEGIKKGYAVVNTDMGMATPPGENASIFINRPERWKDWGYRATHEMTVAAKQIVRSYYQHDARRAYFVGCSTGGEQALMESQRYPDDYDGIVAGAAAQNRTGVHVSILWNFAVNERSPASYLPEAARALLTAAVAHQCGEVITDPTACHFDPASLACKQDGQQNCLTAARVQTVNQIYAGPRNSRTGEQLYPGLPRGSEIGWGGLAATDVPPFAPIFQWVFGKDWDWRQFDFDHQYTQYVDKLSSTLNATSPDIDAFRAHGHKLLIYHGWSDWLVAPGESINYYNAVIARNKSAARDIRLFMVPGMEHCSGGPGATHFDSLGAVVDWVEHRHAPDELMANRGEPGTERMLCPYPQQAEDSGGKQACVLKGK